MSAAPCRIAIAAALTSGLLILCAAPPAAAQPPASLPGADSMPAGVADQNRARQNWVLNCQGCHRSDGTGSAATAPALAGTVSRFLGVPRGRDYLGRVPGVATSTLSNADLAELLNWIFWQFDKSHIPANFSPFTAAEIERLRVQPLRLDAAQRRAELLNAAEAAPR